MGTPSSVRIIEDIDLALKALEIVYCSNGAAFERLTKRKGHRCKEVGEGESVSWGGARTKGEVHKCKLTKMMLFHSDLLRLCHKKNRKITEFFPDSTFFMVKKLALLTNEEKNRVILTNHIVFYTLLTYVKRYQNILEKFLQNNQF